MAVFPSKMFACSDSHCIEADITKQEMTAKGVNFGYVLKRAWLFPGVLDDDSAEGRSRAVEHMKSNGIELMFAESADEVKRHRGETPHD